MEAVLELLDSPGASAHDGSIFGVDEPSREKGGQHVVQLV
jgi:hypothetical protein